MTFREPLDAHLYGRHVAVLYDDQGKVAVEYTDAAIAVGAPARLSWSLPTTTRLHGSAAGGNRWARSVLPEGRILERVAAHLDVDADDTFGLMSVLGRDVAGAITVVARGGDPAADRADYDRPLDDDHLAALVDAVHDVPLAIDGVRRMRLSLAGMQDKLLLHRPLQSRHLYLPTGGAPSTVIVKPEPERFPGLVANELFCLSLAGLAGLGAVGAEARSFGGVACLFVDRYDRRRQRGGRLPIRVHQEDLLGVLGIDQARKYQHGDRIVGSGAWATPGGAILKGPAAATLAGAVATAVGGAAKLAFLDAMTFNVLIGNADAHARNYSVITDDRGLSTLAPLYDLVSTVVHPDLDVRAAQQVHQVEEIADVTIADIVSEATTWGFPAAFDAVAVCRRVENLVERVRTTVDQAATRAADAGAEREHVHRVREVVAEHVVDLQARQG